MTKIEQQEKWEKLNKDFNDFMDRHTIAYLNANSPEEADKMMAEHKKITSQKIDELFAFKKLCEETPENPLQS